MSNENFSCVRIQRAQGAGKRVMGRGRYVVVGMIAAAVAGAFGGQLRAQSLFWDINGATTDNTTSITGNWNGTTANWHVETAPNMGTTFTANTTSADDLTFGSTWTSGTVTVSPAMAASSITFSSTSAIAATTLTGGGITIGGTGASSGIFMVNATGTASPVTINTPLTINSTVSAISINNTSTSNILTIAGSLTGSASTGNVDTVNFTVTTTSGNPATVLSGNISDGTNGGTLALVINGNNSFTNGTVALTGNNTFSGGVTVLSGIVSTGTVAGTTPLGTGTLTLGNAALTGVINDAQLYESVNISNPITVAGDDNSESAININADNLVNSSPINITSSAALAININSGFAATFTGGITGGVTGGGGIFIQGDTVGGGTLTFSGAPINAVGLIEFQNSSPVVVSASIGSNVTDIFDDNFGDITFSGSVLNTGKIQVENNGAGNATFSGAVNNAGMIFNESSSTGTVTFSGTIGSAVTNIVHVAAGNLVLSGPSILNTGSLTFAGNGAGTVTVSAPIVNNTGAIVNGGSITVVVDSAGDTQTFNGTTTGATTISGSIGTKVTSVTQKSLTSVLILSGTNTYLGPTSATTGRLIVTNAAGLGGTSGLTVSGTGRFDYTGSGTLNIGTAGTLSVSTGAVLGVNIGSTINATGAATMSGNVGLVSLGAPSIAGTYTLLSAAGGLNGATYYLLNPTNYTFTLTATSTAVTVTTSAPGAGLTQAFFKGGLTSNTETWAASSGTASNWTTDSAGTNPTGLVPGATTDVFLSASNTTAALQNAMTLGADMTIQTLTVNAANANPVMLTTPTSGIPYTLTIAGNGTNGITVASGDSAVTIGAPVEITSNQTWANNAANTVTFSQNVNLNANTLTFNGTGAGAMIFSVPITGTTGNLVVNNGKVTLSAANTFGGSVTINGGTLNINNNLALGNIATEVFTINGGTIDNTTTGTVTVTQQAITIGGNFTFTGTKPLTLGAGAANNFTLLTTPTITVTSTVIANSLTLSGAIGDGGQNFGITKAGPGTLTFGFNSNNAVNTYTGPTDVTAGTLQIQYAPDTLNTSAIVLSVGARLELTTANISLASLAAGGGVPAGTFLRYSAGQATAAAGPGTIFGTVELNYLAAVTSSYAWTFGNGSTMTGTSTTAAGDVTSAPIILADGATGSTTFKAAGFVVGASGGITGTGNLILNATTANAITISGTAVNFAGAITNSGIANATSLISAPVGSNVTAITESATLSALTISGTLTVNSAGTTLTNSNPSGAAILTDSVGVAGTGNLILDNNSAIANGITFTNATLFINNAGTITNSGTGNSVSIATAVGSNVTGITENSASSALTISKALTVHSPGTTLTNSNPSGTALLTLSFGVNGTGNLILDNNGVVANGITISSAIVNNIGTIINSGTGSSVSITGGVGSNVTGITENSAASGLTISSTALTVHSPGTTLINSNPSGSAQLTISSGVTGTGNLTLDNNSAIINGIQISGGTIANAGTITNAGRGGGGTLISAPISASVTGVIENGATSSLTLSNANLYGGVTTVTAGTLLVSNTTGSATSSGNVTLNGGTLGGSGIISGSVIAGTGPHTIAPSFGLSPTSTTNLSVGSLATNSNTTLSFNLDGAGVSDSITAGTLTLNGGNIVIANTLTGAGSLGYYKLIAYTGSILGTGISSLTLPTAADPDVVYTLDTSHDPGFVDLHRGFLGDANDDGVVNFSDFVSLSNHFGLSNAGWSGGDFNGDGIVNFSDFVILSNHFGLTIPGSSDGVSPSEIAEFDAAESSFFGSPASVPEPTSLALMGLGAATLLKRRRKT